QKPIARPFTVGSDTTNRPTSTSTNPATPPPTTDRTSGTGAPRPASGGAPASPANTGKDDDKEYEIPAFLRRR
ncbi:MAG: hypothetical protein NT023_21845, partial [Armatimonadetes bacterium]|nr:hypothetical protein [Armatimonadota bacterium]